jgi:hypothetical protein
VLVLHENGAGSDIDNTYGVSAASGHLGRRLFRVVRIGFKNNFPDLKESELLYRKMFHCERFITSIFYHLMAAFAKAI